MHFNIEQYLLNLVCATRQQKLKFKWPFIYYVKLGGQIRLWLKLRLRCGFNLFTVWVTHSLADE